MLIFVKSRKFARDRQELNENAVDSLAKATWRMMKYTNLKRLLLFSVRYKVMPKLTPQIWKKIQSTEVRRLLLQRYDGPFKVEKAIRSVAYQLKLPERCKCHPTFYVSCLKHFHGDLINPKSARPK